MGTSAQKLQKIRDSKEAIRLAIAAKGVDIPANTKLADYDDKIALIDEWVAPADWIQLEEPADNEILLLASDINPYYAFVVYVTGDYTVNWGDGTVDNWASGATASHTYAVGTGQSCSRGYTTFKIRIFAQTPANQITIFKVGNGLAGRRNNGLLHAKVATINLTTLDSAFYGSYSSSLILERVELPMSLVNCSSYYSMCRGCLSLHSIRMPYIYKTSQNIDFGYVFMDCARLNKINFNTDALYVISFYSAFYGCLNLKQAILPSIVYTCSSWGYAFCLCSTLDVVILPQINSNVHCGQMFQSSGLKNLVFNDSWNNRITNPNYGFSLALATTIQLPISMNLSGTKANGLLIACRVLKSFRFPDNNSTAITSMDVVFQNCYMLETISNFPSLTQVTTLLSTFSGCYSLKNIDNLDQLGDTTTGMDLAATYSGCCSLNPLGGLRVRNKITGRFVLAGIDSSNRAALTALLFTNPAAVSTWAGSSPQIDVSYCSMEAAALNALFTSIIATSASFSGKTIRITGNPGAATCDTTIITNAGGTVNKTT